MRSAGIIAAGERLPRGRIERRRHPREVARAHRGRPHRRELIHEVVGAPAVVIYEAGRARGRRTRLGRAAVDRWSRRTAAARSRALPASHAADRARRRVRSRRTCRWSSPARGCCRARVPGTHRHHRRHHGGRRRRLGPQHLERRCGRGEGEADVERGVQGRWMVRGGCRPTYAAFSAHSGHSAHKNRPMPQTKSVVRRLDC
jgi:hypothetical protein